MTSTHNNPVAIFGSFIKERRIKLGHTARQVAEVAGIQPSNLSRMEHGTLPPPKDDFRLKDLAVALDLPGVPSAFAEFCDLASKATNAIPLDIKDIITENDAVPLLLRSIGGRKLTQKKINAIIELVRS